VNAQLSLSHDFCLGAAPPHEDELGALAVLVVADVDADEAKDGVVGGEGGGEFGEAAGAGGGDVEGVGFGVGGIAEGEPGGVGCQYGTLGDQGRTRVWCIGMLCLMKHMLCSTTSM